ncbi:MAG: M14 family zinc carboxypeptidase, partial [Saprospiraceae bacterium]|nr:M14 family zinc carboxypeptidase [Saprospiraceae bacterium]
MQNPPLRSLLLLLPAFVLCFTLTGQIPSPEEVFGFRVGADYKLADYDQMLDYYQRLDAATDRVELLDIGTSVAGRPIKLLLISSEENLRNKDRFKNISADLAKARIDEATAKNHAKEGKAVVWFDGGMHASEKAHAQMTSELAWRIAAEESDEMNKIRENVIVVMVPVINPDGVDIVVDWYRQQLGTPYETTNPPILYQKFVGHDNNRDWFMLNMPETRAATRVLY